MWLLECPEGGFWILVPVRCSIYIAFASVSLKTHFTIIPDDVNGSTFPSAQTKQFA